MNLHSTLERVRAFGGLTPADDDRSDVDDYHRYAGTTADVDQRDDEQDDEQDDGSWDDDRGSGAGRIRGWRRRSRQPRANGGAEEEAGDQADDRRAGSVSVAVSVAVDRPVRTVRSVRRAVPEVEIDPRIAARRREVVVERDVRRQRRWLAFAVVTTVLALGYGVTRSGLLDLDVIAVRDGAHTSAADIRAASGLKAGEPLIGLDLDGAAARVRALPWVATVQATRSWDGTVRLDFTERTAAAAVALDDGTALLVDAERRVLGRLPTPPADLVSVTGVGPADAGMSLDPSVQPAVDLARGMGPGVRSRVAAVRVLPGGQLELALRPGGRVVLGAGTDLDRKLLAVRTVLGQVDLAQLCVLDVRVPDTPVLTRAEPCA